MVFENLYIVSSDYKCLFDIGIDSSCELDNYKFWFCEKDNQYYLIWCKVFRRRQLTDSLIAYPQKPKAITELLKDDNFIKYFQSKITYNKIKLNNEQKQMFKKFYDTELDDNIYKPHGLDGFSYYITYYKNNKTIKRYCWCDIPYQWNIFWQVSKEIFRIANLDKYH